MSNLTKYLELQSAAFRLESESIRQLFQNSTNKGSGFEAVLRKKIDGFCSPNWRATHGEIIDSYGMRSGQIDIAIVNDLHPRGRSDEQPEIIMYDATVAVGEAKLLLTSKNCEASSLIASKISDFQLHPDNNNTLCSDIYDKLNKPPFFLLALGTNISLKALEDKLCNKVFQCVIIFSYIEGKSVIAVSETEVTHYATEFLEKIGEKVTDTKRVFIVDNPLLVLAWMVSLYSVPMMNLTPIIPMYYDT